MGYKVSGRARSSERLISKPLIVLAMSHLDPNPYESSAIPTERGGRMTADRGKNRLFTVFAAQGIATLVCFVQGRTSLFLEPLAVVALFSLFLFPPIAFVLAYLDGFHGQSVLTLLASVALSMLQYFLMLPTFS